MLEKAKVLVVESYPASCVIVIESVKVGSFGWG